MKLYTFYKNVFGIGLLFMYWNMCAMEQWEKENTKTLNYSFAQIVPIEMFEKIVYDVVTNSKNAEEAVVSLKGLQCSDKETRAMMEACMADEIFAGTIKQKLAQKAKIDFCMSEEFADAIIEKLLFDPNKLITFDSAVFAIPAYWQGAKTFARFFYVCSHSVNNKNEFFKEVIKDDDIEMIEFCLQQSANPDTKFIGDNKEFSAFEEWTPLKHAITKGNADLVKVLLAHHANPDVSLKNTIKNSTDGMSFVEENSTTVRELAQIKGNQEIIALLENHGAATHKD